VRDGEDEPARVIPRQEWSFARLDAGRLVPDADHVYLAAGFVPGKIYHVIYTTTGAPVIGLGLLAARDTAAFLRHGSAENGNPCAGDIRRAYAFGASQSGRYLRQFLYLGLNEDEQERTVFNGVLVHIAGGKRGGDFNQRFGQPSASLHPTMSNAFPFNDAPSTDPVTGRNDGLLARLAARSGEWLPNSSSARLGRSIDRVRRSAVPQLIIQLSFSASPCVVTTSAFPG
jgi:hypothetical protein